ncbi:hypothetical protein R3P38DRAFT_3348728, partial [Favolaschia claudopus]
MRALSALPLDDDVLDRIFTFCPTFPTLHSLMLVSKAFYTVYQTHPRAYRLWIIWGKVCLIGVLVVSSGTEYLAIRSTLNNDSTLSNTSPKLFLVLGEALSFVSCAYSTCFVTFRIVKFHVYPKKSNLTFFLVIVIESAALQTLWLVLSAVTVLFGFHAAFMIPLTYPAVVGISNLLIHARVGLGWSPERHLVSH